MRDCNKAITEPIVVMVFSFKRCEVTEMDQSVSKEVSDDDIDLN